jgi:hypothetical protein
MEGNARLMTNRKLQNKRTESEKTKLPPAKRKREVPSPPFSFFEDSETPKKIHRKLSSRTLNLAPVILGLPSDKNSFSISETKKIGGANSEIFVEVIPWVAKESYIWTLRSTPLRDLEKVYEILSEENFSQPEFFFNTGMYVTSLASSLFSLVPPPHHLPSLPVSPCLLPAPNLSFSILPSPSLTH